MIFDPEEGLENRLARQQKIIDALIRRSERQNDVGPSAFNAFQSAIALQERVEAQTRDLKRAENELESVRYERERNRRSLVEALSSMAEGVALFMDGQLHVTNDFFGHLLPDCAEDIMPGLGIGRFFKLIAESRAFVGSEPSLVDTGVLLSQTRGLENRTVVVELDDDRWYQLNAQHTSRDNIVLLVTEITDLVRRNRFEKEMLIDLQEDYLRAVFQAMSSGVCTISSTGQIMMTNFRFHELLGLPASAIRPGMSVVELVGDLAARGLVDEVSAARLSHWRDELSAKGAIRRRIRHGDDEFLEIHADRLPDGGFVVDVKDVTLEVRTTEMLEVRVRERTAELTLANEKLVRQYHEKAQVEEKLRIAKEKAEAATSSKTRFLAAASHDLLQPINAAKLLISTLKEATHGTDYFPLVERLYGSFGSAEQLLRSLLDISKLESAASDEVTVTNVSLGAIMGGIHSDQALVAEQKNVKLDVVPCSLPVKSDSTYLLRSIQNLVVNAIQYTEPGGRVLVGCRRKGDRVVVQVWDTGIGIALSDQQRIFEEFTRAESVPLGSGMGLGLSVVDRACRLLGHKLSVRSKPGVGSVFSIEMDVADGMPVPNEPTGSLPETGNEAMDYIVLVIENDDDVLFGTTTWLERQGASVLPARSIDEAVRHVEDIGMPPDIILADYQLDDGDTGVEGITRLRLMTGSHIPAIMITANRSEGLREAGKLNDVAVMTKPVKLARLRQLIDWKVRFDLSDGHMAPASDTY